MGRYREALLRDHEEPGPWIVVLDVSITGLAVVLALFVDPGPGSGGVALAALALPLRHRFPVAVLAVAVLADAADPRLDMAVVIVYFFSVAAVAHHRRRGPVLWAALAIAILLCFDPWTAREWDLEHLPRIAGSLLASIAPVAVGFSARAGTELQRQRELTRRIEREAALDRARADDRRRLALELHDSLGHELSLIAVHAGMLAVTAEDGGRQGAERIGRLARQALAELRQIVFTLGGRAEGSAAAELLSLASVPAMVRRLAEAGMPAELVLDGELGDLPEDVDRLGFRIVQESLTNTLKHAPGAAVRVVLRREPGRLVLDVTNGRAPLVRESPLPNGHVGLAGLAERAARLHGTVAGRPAPDGGWTVHAELPVAQRT
ncbi:sensor histidine kinase [Actinocorallia longicatena]